MPYDPNSTSVAGVQNNAKLGFKVGTQAALDLLLTASATAAQNGTQGPAVHGSFYLTQDTHRLYIGNSNGTLSPVNEGIITVAHISDLPTADAAHAGQFYYITGETDTVKNVLTVCNGHNWIHINNNTDTRVTDYTFATVDLSNSAGVDVQSELQFSNGDSQDSRFYVKGGNGVTVSSGTETITVDNNPVQVPVINIAGDTYTLSSEAVSGQTNQVDIKLDSTNTNNDSSIRLKGGSNVSIAESNGEITIGSRDTRNASMSISNETNGFTVTVTDTYGGTDATATFTPQIAYGGDASNRSTANFNNGVATLNVYTKHEIDETMRVLNAMTYKGTIGSGGTGAIGINASTGVPYDSNNDPVAVRVGDTFLVSSAFNYNNRSLTVGSLLIARGTEDDDPTSATYGYITSNLSFDIVEERSNTDTHYEFISTNTGLVLQASTGGSPGELNFAAGTGITIAFSHDASDSDHEQTITVTHDSVTRSDTTGTAQSTVRANSDNSFAGSKNITVVTGVTTNTQGHVTGVETTQYTITDTNSRISSSTYSSSDTYATQGGKNVGILKHTISETFGGGGTNDVDSIEAISSETLKITADNTNAASSTDNSTVAGLNIELLWGSF